MAYDGLMDDIRTIIDGGAPRRVPVFASSEEFDVKWYDKGTYNDVILDADKMADCWGSAAKEFGYDVRDINDNMYWEYGRKILAAAKIVAQHPNLHIIYITNFKCGPDSFVKGFVRPASGKPFLTLQFDGHSNDAGVMTRCEAYLDSKGILRWWRKSQTEPTSETDPEAAPPPSAGEPSTSPRWPTPVPG